MTAGCPYGVSGSGLNKVGAGVIRYCRSGWAGVVGVGLADVDVDGVSWADVGGVGWADMDGVAT